MARWVDGWNLDWSHPTIKNEGITYTIDVYQLVGDMRTLAIRVRRAV